MFILCYLGKEARYASFYFDGHEVTATETRVYEFHGCYFHAHDPEICPNTRNIKNEEWLETKAKRQEKTQRKKEFSQSIGLQYTEIYECEFQRLLAQDADLRAFVDTTYPTFYRKHRSRKVTEATILQSVLDENLFGAVLCDIKVPEHLYEQFSEFSPFFVTTTIPFEVMSEPIQQYWKETQTLPGGYVRPYPTKRMLVGGMRCSKVLLATPLLQFYLEKGLEVTHVYEVCEYDIEHN